MLKTLLALAFLACNALAGTAHLGATDTTVTLDSPPPGATGIQFRITGWNAYWTNGMEVLDPSPQNADAQTVYGAVAYFDNVTDSAHEAASDRINGTVQQFSFSAYDGVTDFRGTSGATWSESHTKGATGWTTYSGLPSTVQMYRRPSDHYHAGRHVDSISEHATFDCEWTWI